MNPELKQMPLWRDANRLLLLIEDSVRQFPRYYKYTLGSNLRKQAMNIYRLIARAVHDAPGHLLLRKRNSPCHEGRVQHIRQLVCRICLWPKKAMCGVA